MAKKLLLINLIVLAGVLLLAQRLVTSWAAFERDNGGGESFSLTGQAPAVPELDEIPPPENPESLAPFLIIPEKNLFSEMRGVEPETDEDGSGGAPPPLAIKPKLTSISSFGGQRQAVMTIFEGNRGAKPDTQVVKVGDDVQGYEVGRIADSEVGLFWQGAELHTIVLEPADAQPPRNAAARAQAVRIITVGSAGAAVETVSVSSEGEDERGVEVGVVSGPAAASNTGVGAGGRQNNSLRGGTAGRGQVGGRSQLGGRSQFGSRGSSRFGSGQSQTPIGLGSARPSDPNRPPNQP